MEISNFTPPSGLIGTFGVVKLWPGVKVAEDEVIARLKIAAEKLGLVCVEISPEGYLIDSPSVKLSRKDLDFVLHLHFETPKAYDLFSFVALWNPLPFYYVHQPGKYRQYANNIISHDDFLSCSSKSADAHLKRMITHDETRLPPAFTFYHSLAYPVIPPKLGAKKLFYAGINWERLGRAKSRHHDLLELLDGTGEIKIYGPRVLMKVRVWEGFKGYVGPLPFDGVSVVNEIAHAGIVLSLSSDAHKEAELMSNRLFEGLAGGAIIISDENPFARTHFGDTLLYINATLPTEEVFRDIIQHLRWIKENDQEATEMARRAQAIFNEKFRLDTSLAVLYSGFAARREQLNALSAPRIQPQVSVFFFLFEFDKTILDQHITSATAQNYGNNSFILLVDVIEYNKHQRRIEEAVKSAKPTIHITPIDLHLHYFEKKGCNRLRLGKIIYPILEALPDDALVCFVNEGETLFSDHIATLVAASVAEEEGVAVYSDVVIKHEHTRETEFKVCKDYALLDPSLQHTETIGRYLFRKPSNLADYSSILPYLHLKAPALLVAEQKGIPSRRSTIFRVLVDKNKSDARPDDASLENEILMDYLPEDSWAMSKQKFIPPSVFEPASFSLRNLSQINKMQMVKDLILALPVPKFMTYGVFGLYRLVNNGSWRKKT